MPAPTVPLLFFARDLARARTFNELLIMTQEEVARSVGYQTVWLALRDTDDAPELRVLDIAGAKRETLYDDLITIPIEGDAMLAEIFEGNRVVVVDDARTDPRTNKAIVEALQNRTIINVPLAILDQPFGALGAGTFGDEGTLPPTEVMLQTLLSIANLVSVAAGRIRLDEKKRAAEREQRAFEVRLARMQRMDSIGVLAGGVAHDFNNLLTVVLASISLARGAQSPQEIRTELDAIEEVAVRGQALTRQLLAMSRAQPLTLTDLNPEDVIADLVPLLKRVIASSIEIDVITPQLGAFVEADRTQLDQVLMNLCLNARDAMPEGGRLTIESELVVVNGAFRETNPWAKPGRYVLITVSDTGHGIAPEHLERIFEPFFTTKGERAGTGLGLSVAYGIAVQHGGMLHCYSEVGIGSTFKLYLPVLARMAQSVGRKLEGPVHGGSERILIGDDDAAVRNVVRRILQRAGYEVVMAANGDEVLRALEREDFDLLVLDVVMPGPSCATTLERARALRPALRVLLSSGYTADTHVTGLLSDRSRPLLRKPYDPDHLLRALRTELDSPT